MTRRRRAARASASSAVLAARAGALIAAALVTLAASAGCHRGPAGEAPPPVAAPGPALYQRLGGREALAAVVHDFVGRVGADARINAFFRGVDVERLEQLLAEQICQASGGPCRYSGRPMREAHRGMHLTNADFDALVEDLVAALTRAGVAPREQQDLLAALGALRRDIVGR